MSDLLGGRQVKRHAPIREQVAAILRDAIVEMRLKPGEVLIERELCELTHASRPSVREALRQLEAEGLVEPVNGKGTIVAIVTPELAAQVYEVRAELEGLAAELFARHASPETVAEFGAAIDRLSLTVSDKENSSTAAILKVKNEAYEILFNGTQNPILVQMINMLQRRVTQLRALTLAQPGRPEQSLAEILIIRDAIERRDEAAAREAATSHVRMAAKIVLGALAATPA